MANPRHLELARQGRDTWNEWRRQNADEPADFSGVNFAAPENQDICFAEFEIGHRADFSDAKFGDGARFYKAKFGDGAHFYGARFGSGARFCGAAFGHWADFYGTTFGCLTGFDGTTFGDNARFDSVTFGGVSFDGANFGDVARFYGAMFEEGAHFRNARFGSGAGFYGAAFGHGARFDGATFGDGARFDGATIGDSALFDGATIGESARFYGARFGSGARFYGVAFGHGARFDGATFGDWTRFDGATFADHAHFDALSPKQVSDILEEFVRRLERSEFDEPTWKRLETALKEMRANPSGFTNISFRSARFRGYVWFVGRHFDGAADFAHARFAQLPDFPDTLGHDHFNWTGIRFGFRGDVHRRWIRDAADQVALQRWQERWWNWTRDFKIPTPGWTTDPKITYDLRRLRKIATEILAVDTERDLLILQRMAERGILWRNDWRRPWRPLVPTVLMFFYRLFSNCGRSMLLPLFWLSVLNIGLYTWYESQITRNLEIPTDRFSDALLTFTLANAVPFGGGSQQSLQPAIEDLFADGRVQPLIQVVSTMQGIGGAMFIFLLLLAARNYFRFK